MTAFRNRVLAAAISAGSAVLSPQAAEAFDLTGAWAASADQCGKVFVRKGRDNKVSFTSFSGVHGGGFMVEADRLRGRFENCKIKSKKEDDRSVNLIAACASGIMLSNVQFFLKVIDDNTISREFPGIEGMEVKYFRCQI
jgi:hypothetical protein